MGGIATIMGGRATRKAAQAEAKQVGLQAKSQELERREALQDALAMQAVIAGAGGRAAGSGSLMAIRQADIARGAEDVSMIQAGGRAKSASIRAAGRRAEQMAMIKGLAQIAQTAAAAGSVGSGSAAKVSGPSTPGVTMGAGSDYGF